MRNSRGSGRRCRSGGDEKGSDVGTPGRREQRQRRAMPSADAAGARRISASNMRTWRDLDMSTMLRARSCVSRALAAVATSSTISMAE
eukprot:6644286-Pyramimonas_sp.AAC.1